MERLRNSTVFLVLALALLCSAVQAKPASVLLQEGLYAEEVDGDLDAAIKIYEQIIADESAQKSHVAQAIYRQGMCYLKLKNERRAKANFEKLVAQHSDQTKIIERIKPLLEDLINADPATLMPPDTIIYLEFGSPGRQIETILNMLKGTPFENPLSVIRGGGQDAGQGGGPGDIIGALLNPSMMAEFKKIRGMGVGITDVTGNEPTGIVVMFPGRSDALRGIILAILGSFGRPAEAIEGVQTVAFPDGGGAAYDDTVVMIASPSAYSSGQLTRSVKQYKGVTNEPTLASHNKSFIKVGKKARQENLLTIWANIDEVYASLPKIFGEGNIPLEVRLADGVADFKNIDDLIAFLSLQESGIVAETNVVLKDGHRCIAYDLLRTPILSRAGLEAVPPEAIALASIALGEADGAPARLARRSIQNVTGLDVGREIFANIEQVTLFALPPSKTSWAAQAGGCPIANSVGLAITSHDPQQTRRVLTQLLSVAELATGESPGGRSEQGAGKYAVATVDGQKLYCHIAQGNKSTILSLNPEVIASSVSALKGRRSVCTGGPLKEAVSGLPPTTRKVALVNVGGAADVVVPLLLGFDPGEVDDRSRELIAQLAKACNQTLIQVRTDGQLNSFGIHASITGLPPTGQLLGPIMQLTRALHATRAEAKAEELRAATPADIAKANTPPVIDGEADDVWSGAHRYDCTNVVFLPLSSDDDLTAGFKAMWDEDNLYLLVDVTDDRLVNDSDEFWFDDGIELFIDADNSKSDSYGQNDYQYCFQWDRNNPTMIEEKQGNTANVKFAMVSTANRYVTEVKLPWATLGVKPAPGRTIGLDVHIDDDDDGGDRDSKVLWHAKEDVAYLHPSAFGNAQLLGLIGWWKLDEGSGSTVADSSGRGADGTVRNTEGGLGSGGSVWCADPERGTVLSFGGDDNTGAYVSAGTVPAMYPTGGFTWAFWAKQDGNPIDQRYDVVVGNRFSDTHQFIKFTPTRFEYVNRDVRNDINYDDIPEGIWMHHVVVKDGTNLTYYRDGVESGTSTVTTNIEANPFYFGGDIVSAGSSSAGERWRGYIDDVRIYNHAISEAEITALYNEGK
ncbi:MAG: tetratricopeptide repeat protein [Phycisphaerales bacterium]|nr:MAG: tetratricopeptide repeat protein [Phycisphaerales bacterium]